jgi:hypothetical protein
VSRLFACLNAGVARHPGNRRGNGRVAEIEFRRFNVGLGHLHGCRRGVDGAARIVEFLLAQGVGFGQRLDPIEVGLRGPQPRLLLGECALGCV